MSPIRDLHEDRDVRVKAMLLGHIRGGVFNAKANHPEQSDTFVFTSADPKRLEPLAREYGGDIAQYTPQGESGEPWRLISGTDALTGLFPFADLDANLAQSWELWGRGIIKRRCDGFDASSIDVDEVTGEITEEQVPCICAAQDERVCKPTSRLRLVLPETGLGIWELATPSVIAATNLYDQVRFVDQVAAGRMNQVPVRLVYQRRQIRYFDAKEGKQRTTTKRIPSLSVAGNAAQALASLGMAPDQGLLAAVRLALGSGGSELMEGDPPDALPPGDSPATDVPGEQVKEPEAGGHEGKVPASGSDPATETQWAHARQVIGPPSKVLLAYKRHFGRTVAVAANISRDELAELIEEKLAS